MQRKKKPSTKVAFPLSSMIDCTFLLLIYFMTSCSLSQTESDLKFALPTESDSETPIQSDTLPPEEQQIDIDERGIMHLNSQPYPDPQVLTETLSQFQKAAQASRTKTLITINPHDKAPHQSLAQALSCCQQAHLTNITFQTDSQSDDEFSDSFFNQLSF